MRKQHEMFPLQNDINHVFIVNVNIQLNVKRQNRGRSKSYLVTYIKL